MSSSSNPNDTPRETNDAIEVDQQTSISLRALVSTKEAGIIIGKGGQNVALLREETNVKAGISKAVEGVNDRVLTVQGQLPSVRDAFMHIAKSLLENSKASESGSETAVIRLLISHTLMGNVIGRQGTKIKQIQDQSGARVTAAKEMLPQSTERIVEIQGQPGSIGSAVYEVGQCLIDDKERAQSTVLYNPVVRLNNGSGLEYNRRPPYPPRTGQVRRESFPIPHSDEPLCTQSISIPPDMCGCIIGKGGARIAEIRRKSGSKISIAREPDEETGERLFTLVGTQESNEKALLMLYSQLEMEKERRLSVGQE